MHMYSTCISIHTYTYYILCTIYHILYTTIAFRMAASTSRAWHRKMRFVCSWLLAALAPVGAAGERVGVFMYTSQVLKCLPTYSQIPRAPHAANASARGRRAAPNTCLQRRRLRYSRKWWGFEGGRWTPCLRK